MKPFDYAAPTCAGDAARLLAATPGARVLAGGTGLLPLMRRGIETPAQLVSLKAVEGLDSIGHTEDGSLRIGARVRLGELASDGRVRAAYPIVVQSLEQLATPQVRNAATVGGNLCQRPRCWYFRHPDFNCARRDGLGCPALAGQNRYHAVYEHHGCAIVHPSDLAPALIALDAAVEIAGPAGERRLPLAELYVGPAANPRAETILGAGEFVQAVRLPPLPRDARSTFLKLTERRASDFALVSLGAVLSGPLPRVNAVRLVLGGVAPTPLRRGDLEAALVDDGLTPEVIERVAAAAGAGARPLTHNRYKVELVAALLRRGLTLLAGSGRS